MAVIATVALVAGALLQPAGRHTDGEGPLGTGSRDPLLETEVVLPWDDSEPRVWSFGAVPLCAYEDEPLVLAGAAPVELDGLQIREIGVRVIDWGAGDQMILDAEGALPPGFVPVEGFVVDGVCNPTAAAIVELAVAVEPESIAGGSMHDLTIKYQSLTGEEFVYQANMGVVMCGQQQPNCPSP